MENQVNTYLTELFSHLTHLDGAEKQDIVAEVENHIFESVERGADLNAVLQALGDPKTLAQSYQKEVLLKNSGFNLKNLGQIMKFYFITGFSGMFIIPIVGTLSIGLYVSSFIAVGAGVIKTVAGFFGYNLPIAVFNLGFWQAPDFMALPLCLLFGAFFYIISRKMWFWLKEYLFSISLAHRKLKNL